MKLINNKVYFAVQDYLMILLGTLLYGFGFNAFILSNEIITGGVSGICALIFFASNEIIPVSVSYFVINVVLLLAALMIWNGCLMTCSLEVHSLFTSDVISPS